MHRFNSVKKGSSFFWYIILFIIIYMTGSIVLPGLLRVSDIPYDLPQPAVILTTSQEYQSPVLKGLRIDPKDPLKIEFIVDTADSEDISEEESQKLIRYFLAGLTVPEEDLWVNLSPYESDRIVPEKLGITDLGKDLLCQDYVLKQLSSSLTHPDTDIGKEYWQNGTEQLSKIWIVPKVAELYEKKDRVLITKAELDVKSESDCNNVLLPEIRKDINSGENFANLRQMYSSLILARWFKQKFKNSFYKHYIDQGKVNGVDIADKDAKDKIYDLYVKAYQMGVYKFSRLEKDSNQKRQYFCGGADMVNIPLTSASSSINPAAVFTGNAKSIIIESRPIIEREEVVEASSLDVQKQRIDIGEFMSMSVAHKFGRDEIKVETAIEKNIYIYRRIVNMRFFIDEILANTKRAVEARGPEHEGLVTVELKRSGENAVIVISDNGEGIPKDKFEWVLKNRNTLNDHKRGQGQGLTVIQRTVRRLNGTLKVESEQDVGTTLTITFPIAQVSSSVNQSLDDVLDEFVENYEYIDWSKTYGKDLLVEGKYDQLVWLWLNLFESAIKLESTNIHIHTGQNDQSVIVKIQADGLTLLKPAQVDGLKTLAGQVGGTIEVEPEVSVGTTFTITLPVEQASSGIGHQAYPLDDADPVIVEKLKKAIDANGGRITFRDYMQICLQDPDAGYYSTGKVDIGTKDDNEDNIDFHTYPEIFSPQFGYGVAKQTLKFWQQMGKPKDFKIVEMGAGNGTLCRDFLQSALTLDKEFYEAVDYIIVDRGRGLIERQKATNRDFIDKIFWLNASADELPLKDIEGVFISNELIDTFPVHRVRSINDELKEVYLTYEGDNIVEFWDDISDPAIEEWLEQSHESQEMIEAEVAVNMTSWRWLKNVSAALKRGYIITIDYDMGSEFKRDFLELAKDEVYAPSVWGPHLGGSLGNMLAIYKLSGNTDITADVSFDFLVNQGRREGLSVAGLMPQYNFLARNDAVNAQITKYKNIAINFHVLIQSKGMKKASSGIEGDYEKLLDELIKKSKEKDGPLVVGIGGPSNVGKDYFAEHILLSKLRAQGYAGFTLNIEKVYIKNSQKIAKLKRTVKSWSPKFYDFDGVNRSIAGMTATRYMDFIFVVGLHALMKDKEQSMLVPSLDFGIYMQPNNDIELALCNSEKRAEGKMHGYNLIDYKAIVEPDYKKNIKPSRENADYVVTVSDLLLPDRKYSVGRASSSSVEQSSSGDVGGIDMTSSALGIDVELDGQGLVLSEVEGFGTDISGLSFSIVSIKDLPKAELANF